MTILKNWKVIAGTSIMAILLGVFFGFTTLNNPEAEAGILPLTAQYSAKFVCGTIPQQEIESPSEPVLKPGNYATEINIHNSDFFTVEIQKKFVLAPLEPAVGAPFILPPEILPPDHAFSVDCTEIALKLSEFVSLPPFITGFVVIDVPLLPGLNGDVLVDPLDVVAVYTSLKEVTKNKILFEFEGVKCDPIEDETIRQACEVSAKELESILKGKNLEIVTEIRQDRVIIAEDLAKNILRNEFGIDPLADILIKLTEVDLGVGVGESIDVERVPVKIVGFLLDGET